MSDYKYVTDRNPHAFLEELVKSIAEGFYVTDTIPGVPRFDLINEVELTKTDKPSQRNDLTNINEVTIAGYHDHVFLLDLQDALLQGFEVVEDTFEIAPPHAPHQVRLRRPAVADTNPVTAVTGIAQKAKGGRPPKAKAE